MLERLWDGLLKYLFVTFVSFCICKFHLWCDCLSTCTGFLIHCCYDCAMCETFAIYSIFVKVCIVNCKKDRLLQKRENVHTVRQSVSCFSWQHWQLRFSKARCTCMIHSSSVYWGGQSRSCFLCHDEQQVPALRPVDSLLHVMLWMCQNLSRACIQIAVWFWKHMHNILTYGQSIYVNCPASYIRSQLFLRSHHNPPYETVHILSCAEHWSVSFLFLQTL